MEGGEQLTSRKAAEVLLKKIQRSQYLPNPKRQWVRDNAAAVLHQLEAVLKARQTKETKEIRWRTNIQINDNVLRAIAKIGCNFFAAHHRATFCGPEFNAARDYVWENRGDPPMRFHYPPPEEAGALRHVVSFDVHPDGKVLANVTLFGHLCFNIFLGQVKTGSVWLPRLVYIVDQVTQTAVVTVPTKGIVPFSEGETIFDSRDKHAGVQKLNLICAVETAVAWRKLALSPNVSEIELQGIMGDLAARVSEALVTGFPSAPATSG